MSSENHVFQVAAPGDIIQFSGTLWMTDVCNAVVKNDKVPEDWSWLEQELDGECLQTKEWCTDMWLIQGHKAIFFTLPSGDIEPILEESMMSLA